MDDHAQSNRRLWNEWSDAFQAAWNADTDDDLPPAPSPFDADAPGFAEQSLLDASDVEGADYVELGCGGGQGTVGTAELGADAVGLDFSEEQLAHARRLRDFYGADARFAQGDVTSLPFPDDRFDLASSEAAFQMVADLDRALAEAHRVLRPGGVFVLSVPHPLYEAFDAETSELTRDYLDPGPRDITISEEYGETLTVFDRPIDARYNALAEAGFDVHRLVEHQHPHVAENDPGARDLPDALWKVPRSVRFWAVA
ncbi:class I SAM-dependent methyltransferase [Salarchaeum japonicum]|uniref:Methyltransferase type 11 domain-containing protein n=1 Tax=Salarchaeum japonicum TaxID=555573 RepID=A0AAV3SZ25_9EURY|nr:class I SAM-dependent methyltransferase [Salarchaeum japonicum]